MSTLPPTPNLGLVLPDPGTGQPFSTATQNGWFQTIDTAVGGLRGMANPATQAFRSSSSSDVSLTSTTHPFQLGPTAGINLRADGNEIQAVNNGAPSNVGLNFEGGRVDVNGLPITNVIPSGQSVAAGTLTVDPDFGYLNFNALTTVRLNDCFPNQYTAYEVVLHVYEMVAGTGIFPFLGLAANGTTQTALALHRTTLGANGTNPITTAQTGQSTCAICPPDPGTLGLVLRATVHNAAQTTERTKVSFETISETNSGEYTIGSFYNTAAAGDTDLRFGMAGGAGTMSGRGYIRGIGRVFA